VNPWGEAIRLSPRRAMFVVRVMRLSQRGLPGCSHAIERSGEGRERG
jgi:hypothetical protein